MTASPSALDSLATDDQTARRASAHALQILSAARPRAAESRRAARLARLLADDDGRDLLLDLTDQVMRIGDARRAARRLADLARAGLPRALGPIDRSGLAALGVVAPYAPRLAQRAVRWRVGRDTAGVVLPADDPAFGRYLAGRRGAGFRLNVNLLGEAILGDAEAKERARRVRSLVQRPDVDYVSVKISAICANLDVLAWDDSLARIEEQLVPLYRAAAAANPRTFVNLDMEEYRDLELSLAAFMRVLDRTEFLDLPAGIVLQAYLPDSHAALERLCAWANDRHARGGAPVKVRIVKGANLAAELVEAEQHGWTAPTYATKAEVDASYKRMLDTALDRADPGALRIGVASHNLFEVGWALAQRETRPGAAAIEIEMLEGMAPAQARATRDVAGSLLLYAPIVARDEWEASIAYLSRRLDENAAPENFLRALLEIEPGSSAWIEQENRFRASVADRHTVSTASRRQQDRTQPAPPHPTDGAFANAADTDVTRRVNRDWIAAAMAGTPVPSVDVMDTTEEVDALVARARRAQQEWARTSWAERRRLLAAIADEMELRRADTIAIMATTTGKTVREGDPEVSEAVDFTTYAAHLTVQHERLESDGAAWAPHPVVLVAGPWNFPYAIPASGVVHAIAAGSAVILKPAPQARAVAAALVAHVVSAGAPDGLVQLACTPDDEVGRRLVTHGDVDLVVLTGSYETASMFVDWRPEIRLLAETSGKNSLVITQAADLDQAVKDLVRSAFGHAGQKCSAASLAIVEAQVYDDPGFRRRLADAVESLTVGTATDPATIMGPLIEAPSERLSRALTQLEPGESWLVEPRCIDEAANLWTPGVRMGVAPGSWFHLTECFGPVLGVMRAPDLPTAIAWQNQVEFGLTGGIHSLDPAEIASWLAAVQVGNAYVNRHITGAVVQRQPFGGWKRSSIGPGSKPGGPSHLHGYGTWTAPTTDGAKGSVAFAHLWRTHFCAEHDPSGLLSESNVLRYRPLDHVVVRVARADDRSLAVIRTVSQVTGVPVTVSVVEDETDEALAARLPAIASAGAVRLRLPVEASGDVHRAALAAGVAVDRSPVVEVPEVELTRWVLEQAVSRTMHRYGRLLRR